MGFKEPEALAPNVWYGTPINYRGITGDHEIQFDQVLSFQAFD